VTDYRSEAEDAKESYGKFPGYLECKGGRAVGAATVYGAARGQWRRTRGEWSVVEVFGTASLLERHSVGNSTDGVLRGVLFCKQANSWKLKIWVRVLCETVCGLFACWC